MELLGDFAGCAPRLAYPWKPFHGWENAVVKCPTVVPNARPNTLLQRFVLVRCLPYTVCKAADLPLMLWRFAVGLRVGFYCRESAVGETMCSFGVGGPVDSGILFALAPGVAPSRSGLAGVPG
jgi:hypothetical protein